ncbi:hypothetical protein ACQ5SK_14460 [Bradyrhizobium japonicum]
MPHGEDWNNERVAIRARKHRGRRTVGDGRLENDRPDSGTQFAPAGRRPLRSEPGKDSCGVGFIANIKGKKSHEIVADALSILCNLRASRRRRRRPARR